MHAGSDTHPQHDCLKGNTVFYNYRGRRRGIALLSGAAVIVGAVGMVGGTAIAAPGDGSTGTLSVYKLEQPEGTVGPNDGSAITGHGATPLVAGFNVCEVADIDLTNSADWLRLGNLSATLGTNPTDTPTVAEGGSALALGSCAGEQLTSATTGGTTFTLAADRAYVVWESTLAQGAVAPAQPTIVTVPYPGTGAAGAEAWNYNPHIYPKNTLLGSGASKDGKIVGDKVTFDINMPIKPLAPGETYSEYKLTDRLSSGLAYTGNSVRLYDSADAAVAFDDGTDYTITAAQTPATGGNTVVLQVTPTGVAKLDSTIGGRLHLRLHADAIETGDTSNSVEVTINGTSGPGPEVIDPEKFWGGAHIMKEARNKGAATNVALAGAEFSVVTAPADATTCPSTPDSAETVVFSGQKSRADGTTPNMVLAEGNYCVYETLVPAGYKGLEGGLPFAVTGADAELTVVNTQIGADEGDLPSLPLTGASGSVLLLAGGGLLLALGVTLYVVRARKREQTA